MALALPEITCTEDAVAFGRFMTRDQFIFLAGARAALRLEFDLAGERIGQLKLQRAIKELDHLRADLAYRMQLLREAMEAAPGIVLASIIGTGLGITAAEQSSSIPSRTSRATGCGARANPATGFDGLHVSPAPAISPISDLPSPISDEPTARPVFMRHFKRRFEAECISVFSFSAFSFFFL